MADNYFEWPPKGEDTCVVQDRDQTLSERVSDLHGQMRYMTEQLEKLSAAFNELNSYIR